MMAWRSWALVVGLLLVAGGIYFWIIGGGALLLIAGAAVILTSLLEPVYGRTTTRPLGARWRPTDERFVDPEQGKLVTVWFDPATGERRYVTDERPNLK